VVNLIYRIALSAMTMSDPER